MGYYKVVADINKSVPGQNSGLPQNPSYPPFPQQPVPNQPVFPQQTAQVSPAPQTPAPQPTYAGFWVRYAAYSIDGFFLGIIGGTVGGIFGVIVAFTKIEFLRNVSQLLAIILGFTYAIFFTAKSGATLGKKAFSLKVIDSSLNIPSIKTAILREVLGKLASGVALLVGYAWVGFDKEKQAFHDKIASTHVVITKPLTSLQKFFVYFLAIGVTLAIAGFLLSTILLALNPAWK